MKILVAIASFGTNNDVHLARLLQEYRSMPYDIDLVVLSNIPKALGQDVEVVVGLPNGNPWSLPFAHKPIFAERAEQYDLFIYSEDDTLITQANIEAYLWATSVLPADEIAGFLRSEQGADGSLHYSTIHSHYHWDVQSVCRREGETFAHFTNEHGACYILTRDQLRKAIASGGFSVAPHEGKYDLLVTAATDPYTQCGFTKLVCVSRLPSFTCKHLTNKYVGRTGIRAELVQMQIDVMLDIDRAGETRGEPIRVTPKLPGARWIKSYYEPCREDLVALVPASAKRVLSVGCGWGSTEEALVRKGLEVTAVPLDVVIGRLAQEKGVKVLACGLHEAPAALAGQTFDALLISDLLHLVDDPVDLLRLYRPLLSAEGVAIASVPNMEHAAVWWRRLRNSPEVRGLGDYGVSGVHVTSLPRVTQWLRRAGFNVVRAKLMFSDRWARYHRYSLGLLGRLWAYECSVLAHRHTAEATPAATARP